MISVLEGRDPANTGMQRDLSISWIQIGNLRAEQGDMGEALTAYEAAIEIRRVLAEHDPANIQWQVDFIVACLVLGTDR